MIITNKIFPNISSRPFSLQFVSYSDNSSAQTDRTFWAILPGIDIRDFRTMKLVTGNVRNIFPSYLNP